MCLTNGTTPVRLSRCSGTWELELYELVCIDRDVYRPRRSRLHGVTTIVGYLREHDASGTLALSTARLLDRHGRGQGGVIEYVAMNGGWCPPGKSVRSRTLVTSLPNEPRR